MISRTVVLCKEAEAEDGKLTDFREWELNNVKKASSPIVIKAVSLFFLHSVISFDARGKFGYETVYASPQLSFAVPNSPV